MNLQLQEYVKQQRASGANDAQIVLTLKQAGWQEADVAEALGQGVPKPAGVPVPQPGVPQPQAATPMMPINPFSGFKFPALDQKTTGLITTCTIFNVIGTAIADGGTFVSQFFMGGYLGALNQYARLSSDLMYQYGITPYSSHTRYWLMSPSSLIYSLIYSAIGGAVLGYILAAFWLPIKQYANQYSGGKLNSAFKILFFPT